MNQCNEKTLEGRRCRNKSHTKLCFRHDPASEFCKKQLEKKIRINIEEYKTGRWVSPKQAVAVSYSQTKRRFPECEFKRR